MATHHSILSWTIPWTVEPGGLQSMKSQRVRHKRTTYIHSRVSCGQEGKIFSFYPCNSKNRHLVVPDGLCLFIFNWKNFQEPFFFFSLLYLQGYQGVLSSLLFISIFNQGLIHKKILNGKSENLERVVN